MTDANAPVTGILAMPPLSEALGLAAFTLPRRTFALDAVSLETALAAAAEFSRRNHAENEVLMCLTWLLPAADAVRLTPDYLLPTLEALPLLWRRILDELCRTEAEGEALAVEFNAPKLAKCIAATFLRILNNGRSLRLTEVGRRNLPEETLFYRNFLAVARALALNAPDISGDLLLHAVKSDIREAGLRSKLLPDECADLVWAFRVREEVPEAERRAVISKLRSFLCGYWLSTKAAKDVPTLYLLAEESRSETVPALERFVASIGVRFSRVFAVERVLTRAEVEDSGWSRPLIDHWHMGLRYRGMHQSLLHSRSVDPFADRVKQIPSGDLKTQIEQLKRLR